MTRFIILTFVILLKNSALAQLQVASIPDSLLSGADATIRYDSTFFTVLNASSTELTRKYAITIHNGKKKHLAEIYLPHDLFCKVEVESAFVRDKNGDIVRKLKKKDIQDIALQDGVNMVTDNRALAFDLTHISYPYTVEVAYKERYTGTMFYPVWMPIRSSGISLENGYFTTTFPSDNPLRYFEKNTNVESVNAKNGLGNFSWTAHGLKPFKSEPYSSGLDEVFPVVYTAPSYFEMQGYSGELTSWESYGNWIARLNSGHETISENLKQTIRNLTDTLENDEQKINAIYQYLQKNSRYISIQLGIGGWQPFPASFVEEKKYGDCKALSNFMKSLLAVVDIDAHYALIRAGNRSDMLVDFPNAFFNHAIVCVPNRGDTIWLECTSQTNPTGYQGTFTGNRHALLITEEGGKVVRTSHLKTSDNLMHSNAKITLAKNGSAKVNLQLSLSGTQIENGYFYHMVNLSQTDQEEWLRKFLNFNSTQFSTFKFGLTNDFKGSPQGNVTVEFNAQTVTNISGNRIIFNPSIFNQFKKPVFVEPRTTSLLKKYGTQEFDEIEYELPPGYFPEMLPKDVELTTPFGKYTRTLIYEDNILTVKRNFIFNEGIYDVSKFQEFSDFLKEVSKHDSEQVVILDRT